uniref:acetyl-CoA carboxylase n=1 Tax=Acidicaldus sp. TaxID=1872105 RepID=A0A8J4HBR9_9PROT
MRRLLIANRGEVAVRIARAAAEHDIHTIALYAADDSGAPYLRAADETIALPGAGPSAYLDADAILAAAAQVHADALHPGWGFLSENAKFAAACAAAGVLFVGPSPEILGIYGDKSRARMHAAECGVPVLEAARTRAEAEALLATGAIMLKAVAGGGGRGMRIVRCRDELLRAWEICATEAAAAFGNSELYGERLCERARHVEVQILGDGCDVVALGARECSLQRHHQKLIESAPVYECEAIIAAACKMARAVGYRGLGTWEFLRNKKNYWFLEVNPRLQVEHTVTEMVSGVDLVRVQLDLAEGTSLDALGLAVPPALRGFAIELRINGETMAPSGMVQPASGTITRLELPSGPGVRVDHAIAEGYAPSPAFDSLLAKLIVLGETRAQAMRRARRALGEFRIAGIATNIPLLQHLLAMPEVIANDIHTRFIEEHADELAVTEPLRETPLEGLIPLHAQMTGTVVTVAASVGDKVQAGDSLVLIEAMKMQVAACAPCSGVVRAVLVRPGELLREGAVLAWLEASGTANASAAGPAFDPEHIRRDLAEVIARHAATLDAARPEAVARRHQGGKRTVRENLADLLDPGSFTEYGPLALAAQRRRRPLEELIRMTPADGLVAGIGTVGGRCCAVLAYDYTVLAGTQGFLNHKKTDRLLRVVAEQGLPLVLFAEGGGGRPGDSDVMGVAGLDLTTFARFAALSGAAPLIGVVSGFCFAGNAALLGCCDVIIATKDASIGMGGPAMIEGGGLGVFRPEEVGPVTVQAPNGVIDLVVADEAAAVAATKNYLSYFNDTSTEFTAPDQRRLREAVPEDRKRAYDMRALIALLADEGSILELRRDFGPGMITALIRIAGQPFGLIANQPLHLGGAIDAPGADKAARFLQLCDAHGLAVVSLCDTPGFMVGPETERTAQVRHVCRMFVVGAALRVPLFCVVTRKGYGLGAMAMAGGGFHETIFTAAWPSAEFGGMGLEGAVRLGYRRELDAVANVTERQALFENLVRRLYAEGKAINMASFLEIDAVIDPAETRAWLARGRKATMTEGKHGQREHRFIDPW